MKENGNFKKLSLGNLGEVKSSLVENQTGLTGQVIFEKKNGVTRSVVLSDGQVINTEGFLNSDKVEFNEQRANGLISLFEHAVRLDEASKKEADNVLKGIAFEADMFQLAVNNGEVLAPGMTIEF